MPANSTFEFKAPIGGKQQQQYRESYLFVVDLCISEKELNAVKEALVDVVSELPEFTNVGLITFNQYVYAY
jgi:hypothetical protein